MASESCLPSFPNEIYEEFVHESAEEESTKLMSTLSGSCKQLHCFFQPILKERELAHYINRGEIEKVVSLVKANPHLLLMPVDEVVNRHTGQITKQYKPLQLAYGEGDDEMCVMLSSLFKLVRGDEEAVNKEIRHQLDEKFGEGSEDEVENDEAMQNHLAAVLQAIANERFNNGRDDADKIILSEATQIAIAVFREAFTASQPRIIHHGMRFRLELLREVYKTSAVQALMQNWDNNQAALLNDAVMSFVFSYVPENEAMRFNQGLFDFQVDGIEKFKRLRTTRHGDDFYLASRSASPRFSLSGSYIDIWHGCSRQTHSCKNCNMRRSDQYRKHVERKREALKDFADTYRMPLPHHAAKVIFF